MKRILFFVFAAAFLVSVFSSNNSTFAARMSDEDLAKKREGWYPTGLPLVNFSSDTGLGYGLRLYLYNNGSKEDPAFAYTPYSLQTYIQYFATTGGWQYHEWNVDKMKVFGSDFRVKTSLVFEKKLNANYFERGENSTKNSLTDANGIEYDTYEDYQKDFLKNRMIMRITNLIITLLPHRSFP